MSSIVVGGTTSVTSICVNSCATCFLAGGFSAYVESIPPFTSSLNRKISGASSCIVVLKENMDSLNCTSLLNGDRQGLKVCIPSVFQNIPQTLSSLL